MFFQMFWVSVIGYKNSKKDVFSRSNNGVIYAKLTYLFDVKKRKQ